MKGYTGQKKQSSQEYATIQPVGSDKYGIDMLPKALFQVGLIRTVEAGSTTKIIKLTAHGARLGDVLRFAGGLNTSVESPVTEIIDADNIRIGNELDNVPLVTDTFYIMRHITLTIDSSGNLQITSAPMSPIQYIDNTGDTTQALYIDPSVDTIPKSSVNAIQITNATTQDIKQVKNSGDVGFYMALYTDAARVTLLCILPLTPDETIDVFIPSGTTIYLGALFDVDIADASTLVLQFLG